MPWKCPKIVIGDVPIVEQNFSWSLTAGVIPYVTSFQVPKGELADRMHNLVNPVTVSLEVTGGTKALPELKKLTLEHLYIKEFRGVDRYHELVIIADSRFAWRGRKIYCSFNKTRIKNEKGTQVSGAATNDPARLRLPFDRFAKGRYLLWSLKNKELPYTVQEMVYRVLDDLQIRYRKNPNIKDDSYIIENVNLNGIDVYRGLNYLMDLSRLSMGILTTGEVYIYSRDFWDQTKLNALALVQNKSIVSPGNIYKQVLKRVRPNWVYINFEKLVEVRLVGTSYGNTERAITLQADPPVYTQEDITNRRVIACENVLRNPYPAKFFGASVGVGEWVTMNDFLSVWNISHTEVQENFHGERLIRIIALRVSAIPAVAGTEYEYEQLAAHLAGAIKGNYRTTYMIEKYYMQRMRKWVARRCSVINVYDHYNPRSPLWADYCVIPHMRQPKISKRTAAWSKNAYNWEVKTKDPYRQKPTAGTINILDQAMGVFRVSYPPELGDGVIQRFFPFALDPLPFPALGATITMLESCHLKPAHTLETVVSVIWDVGQKGKFDDADKFFTVELDFTKDGGLGPAIYMLSTREQARYSLKQLDNEGQITDTGKDPVNAGILDALASAEGARLMNQYIDRYTGMCQFSGLVDVELGGSMRSITYTFSPTAGLTTSLDLRRLPATPTLEQRLPQDAIDYLRRHVTTGDNANLSEV